MTHTDIKTQGWIDNYVPEYLRPFAYAMRLDRPIGTWLLLLPAWWTIMLATDGLFNIDAHDIKLIMLFGVGAIIMRGAGCIINDLWDRKLDQSVARTKRRPLANGDINIKQAVTFAIFLFVIGFSILIQMGPTAIMLGILSVFFIIFYPAMKRITWWPQAFLGLTFNFGALIGWASVAGYVELPALIFYIGGFFWTLAYDTIYAAQDVEDDALIGIRSTARLFGKHIKKCVVLFYAISWLLFTLAIYAHGGISIGLIVMVVPAYYIYMQVMAWKPDDHMSSLKTFKNNRNFALLILLACALAL